MPASVGELYPNPGLLQKQERQNNKTVPDEKTETAQLDNHLSK